MNDVTLPKTDRLTLEAVMLAKGLDPVGKYPCPSCRREFPAFALVDVSDIPDIPENVACADCLIDARRFRAAANESATPESTGWGGPEGLALKAARNRLLDSWAWTVRSDSPLSEKSQSEFMKFLQSLHRMTIDFARPDDVVWPIVPTVGYA